MVSSACMRTSSSTCRAISSWGARVERVSSMLAMSLTSVMVAISSASSYSRQRFRQSSTLPTAGGQAQVFPYIGHSCSQIQRMRSEKHRSSVRIKAY